MALEAYWRVQDPVYGSSAKIAHLQDEIRQARSELALTRAQIAMHQDLMQQQSPTQPNQPTYRQRGEAAWTMQDGSFLLPNMPHLPPDF